MAWHVEDVTAATEGGSLHLRINGNAAAAAAAAANTAECCTVPEQNTATIASPLGSPCLPPLAPPAFRNSQGSIDAIGIGK